MAACLASSCQGSGGRKSVRCGCNYNAAGIARVLSRSAAVVVVAAAVACTNLVAAACLWTQAGRQAGRAPCMGACGFTCTCRCQDQLPSCGGGAERAASGGRPSLARRCVVCVCVVCQSSTRALIQVHTHKEYKIWLVNTSFSKRPR